MTLQVLENGVLKRTEERVELYFEEGGHILRLGWNSRELLCTLFSFTSCFVTIKTIF